MATLMRSQRKKKAGRRAIYGPLAFLVACAVLIFLMSIFFRISTVEVQGNSYYTAQEIQDAAGLVEGDNLFFINRFRVVSRIFARLPYIEDVSIKRYLPNKVVLTVSECVSVGYVTVEGEAWVIDRSCRILEKAGDEALQALMEVRGVTPLTTEIGKVFETGTDDAGKMEYLCEILDGLQELGMYQDVDYIDISSVNSPVFSYLGRFKVELGEQGDTQARLGKLLSAVSQLTENDRGTIDVSGEGAATVFSPY
jgi:cell division protein FtsQ